MLPGCQHNTQGLTFTIAWLPGTSEIYLRASESLGKFLSFGIIQSQVKVNSKSSQSQVKVNSKSSQGQIKVKSRSIQSQVKVKSKSSQGQF